MGAGSMEPHPWPRVATRPEEPADEPFVAAVYASTRETELAPLGWSEERKTEFARTQFDAQRRYYREHYLDTSWDLILVDGEPAGRLYVARWREEIRIVDIALLPGYRRMGIGTALLREILAEAEAARKPVTIHVEIHNPARHLYERLGFRAVADRGVYVLMERRPRFAVDDAAVPQPNTAS